jgi:hypothetical protein
MGRTKLWKGLKQLPHKKITMRLFSTVLLLIGCGFVCDAQAQSYLKPKPPKNALDERFRIEVGTMYGSYDTKIRIDERALNGATTRGTVISAEDDLGLKDAQLLGQVELTLLPGRHHMVRFTALSMRRKGATTLTRNVSWEDSDFLVGERIDSYFNLSLVGLTYGWLPIRNDRYELGLSFGLQVGSVSGNAEALATQGPREAESAAGPLPLVGIEGRFDITKRWSVDARWQYLQVSWFKSFGDLNDVNASITDGRLAVRWRQNQHLIYGLGYRYFNIDVLAPTSDPSGEVTLNFAGPLLFIQASL